MCLPVVVGRSFSMQVEELMPNFAVHDCGCTDVMVGRILAWPSYMVSNCVMALAQHGCVIQS